MSEEMLNTIPNFNGRYKRQIATVYKAIVDVFYEYFMDDNCIADGPVYFRKKLDYAESIIHGIYNNEPLADKLLEATEVTKNVLCTADCSLILLPWYEHNPNLRFFSAPFELSAESPALVEKIKRGETLLRLDYYPTRRDMVEYREYFRKLNRRNREYNLNYTRQEMFYHELINTVKIIFSKIEYI